MSGANLKQPSASGRHRRTAWATGLSLVLHGLALTGMVLGLRVVAPPPEDRAMELRLIPAFEPQPRPEVAHRRPERSNATPSLRPRPTPQPSSEAPVAALPETPAPAPAPIADAGPKGLLPSLSGRLGCDDSVAARLTPEQRQVCANNLARLTLEARPLGLNIPEQKKADYDRYVRCGETYRHAGVPSLNERAPDGTLITGPSAGLGYIPGECLRRN